MCADEFKKKECYGDGKFCSPNHSSFNTFSQGKDIVLEDLRELCLHSRLQDQERESVWWDYMRNVHS
jgi:hypothetical protein